MKLTNLYLALAIGAAIFTSQAFAAPDTSSFRPDGFPTRVTTKEQAMKCCLPKEKVALACKDCKTVAAKSGEDKKAILAWFKADSTHDCSGCGGKITVRQIPAGQGTGTSISEYKHVCSKCSADSAFTCATHKG